MHCPLPIAWIIVCVRFLVSPAMTSRLLYSSYVFLQFGKQCGCWYKKNCNFFQGSRKNGVESFILKGKCSENISFRNKQCSIFSTLCIKNGVPFVPDSKPVAFKPGKSPWARIFKPVFFWSPGIDSKEWIPPAYVAWRAGTITLFFLGS